MMNRLTSCPHMQNPALAPPVNEPGEPTVPQPATPSRRRWPVAAMLLVLLGGLGFTALWWWKSAIPE
jgi:hypothetical protein